MDARERPGDESAEGMGGEADESLTREALPGGPPPERWRAAQRRALRALTGLAALGLLAVLTMSGVVPRLLGGVREPGTAPGDAAQAADATRAAQQAATDARQGWLAAGPAGAESLVFAPSAPATAYTCGVPENPGGFGRVVVWISQDGGATWDGRPTPAEDQVCTLTVNPTDSRDVVLSTTSLVAAGGEAPTRLYRSLDGGATWRAFPPPPRTPGDSEAPGAYQWAWVGGTLYVAPYYASASGYLLLAVSEEGAPLRWLDTAPLFAGFGHGASINALYASARSLYVEVERAQGCSDRCFGVRRTADGGTTWTDFAPAVDGYALFLVGGQPDGAALFAQYYTAPYEADRGYVRSTDDGVTWTVLPPLPGGLVAMDLALAPNGDVYAALWSFSAASSSGEDGIYALRAGTQAWRLAAPYPQNGSGALILSWDARGRTVALWADISEPTGPGSVVVGVERHDP